MHPSDYFKSMSEVESFVAGFKGMFAPDDYEFLRYYFGLHENNAVSVPVIIQGNEVRIDSYIAPMIDNLNNRGIQTIASCSGLQEEHLHSKFKPGGGYLSIAFDEKLLEFLQSRLDDPSISVSEDECYLKPAVLISIANQDDSSLKEKWGIIENVLGDFS